jgi:hypothetical protein
LYDPNDALVETKTLNAAGEVEFDAELREAGTWSVEEILPAGWDPDGSTACQFNVAYPGAEGQTFECMIDNVERARVNLEKLVSGAPSTVEWTFSLTGPQVDETVTFTHMTDFNGATLIIGEEYTLCEFGLPVSWMAEWMIDGMPVTPVPDTIDNSIQCVDFAPMSPDDAGRTFQFVVNNIPGGGEPRTIGYWKAWSSCTNGRQVETAAKNGGSDAGFWLLDDVLPLTVGDYEVTRCEDGVSLLEKRDVNSGKKRANDAAYALASQLLAAKANFAAGAETCLAATEAVVAGDALLASIGFDGSGQYLRPKDSEYVQARELADTLDQYNNGYLCSP